MFQVEALLLRDRVVPDATMLGEVCQLSFRCVVQVRRHTIRARVANDALERERPGCHAKGG